MTQEDDISATKGSRNVYQINVLMSNMRLN